MDRTQVLPGPVTAGAAPAGGRLSTDTNPGFRLPADARRPTWVPYAVGLVVAALLLLAVLRACAPSDNSAGSSGSASSGSADGVGAGTSAGAADGTVTVRAADFQGRRVTVARAALIRLGLRVRVQRTPGGGEVATVKSVSPTGPLARGTLVTLRAVAAATPQGATTVPDSTRENGNGKGKDTGKTKGIGKGQ